MMVSLCAASTPSMSRSGRLRRSPAPGLASTSAKAEPLSRISVRMKLEVPLMMPAIHSMRLADRPAQRLMMGMPPATAASKPPSRLFPGAGKDFVAVHGQQFLLAVTTYVAQLSMAASTSSLAMPVPPIRSTTMSMSGWRATAKASSATRPRRRRRWRGRRPDPGWRPFSGIGHGRRDG